MIINTLTYNISWATQQNIAAGSEKEFVEACQKEYKLGGLQCTNNAIKTLGKLEYLDLVFLQEVNSNIENKIMKLQPKLKKFIRGHAGVSIVSTLWNPEVFGKVIYQKEFNLVPKKLGFRPCLILVFEMKNKEEIILINVHMPWEINYKKAYNKLISVIYNDIFLKNKIFDEKIKIIMGGDFNDHNNKINNRKPFIVKKNSNKSKKVVLNYKKKSKKKLISCCWLNDPKKYFTDTGDYILVNKNIKQKTIEVPKLFRKKGRKNRLFSDHMPIISTLEI